MRTASGGVFKVQSYTPNAPDTLPPSRIQDLVYTSFSYDNSTVTLSWTAVGDDMDQGTAYSYELRYSTNFSEVRGNFNNCNRVTQDQLVYGNLSHINPSGVIESVTITLPEKGGDIVYYFAIRAWDEAGNGGQLSNTASLSIRFIPLAVTSTVDPTVLATDALTEIGTVLDQTELITNLDTLGTTEATSEVTATSSDMLTLNTVTPDGRSSTQVLTTEDVFTTLQGPRNTPGEITTENRPTTTDASIPRTSELLSTTGVLTSNNPGGPLITSTIDPSTTTLQQNLETTEAKEPTPSERSQTTLQQDPETTEAKEPTGQEDQALIIGLSCALGAVSIVAGVSLMYIYYLKHSLTQVKPTTPPKSAWTQQQGLPDVEMVQQSPTYDNPTFSTA
eukprot:XP_011675713.1 PREDICTED: uncharacterized protein LOC105443793 [Strongylocentrotus purpuratus]